MSAAAVREQVTSRRQSCLAAYRFDHAIRPGSAVEAEETDMTPIQFMVRPVVIALAVLASRNDSAMAADAVTPQSLLAEMSDLSRLATAPSPAYTTKQSASNDPQSVSPADP